MDPALVLGPAESVRSCWRRRASIMATVLSELRLTQVYKTLDLVASGYPIGLAQLLKDDPDFAINARDPRLGGRCCMKRVQEEIWRSLSSCYRRQRRT
ncbi:hypothetical protein GQ600_400 [Phytophthora cactorum]|nr:hypothetical protein GQ600_400 [Phytophthora cactorum]